MPIECWQPRAAARCWPRLKSAWLVGCSICVLSLAAAQTLGFTEKLLAQVMKKYGAAAKARVLDWQQLIVANGKEPETMKLNRVNRFFNQVEFISDYKHWGKVDYWATPLELLGTNGGDCEDFSIAKYFSLIEMGVPVERLQITYVKALKLNQAHMVLTYYVTPDAEPLVLDNLVDEIKPASERTDLEPVYSFNGGGLWLAKERGRGRLVGGADRIGLWSDLVRRMNEQAAQE